MIGIVSLVLWRDIERPEQVTIGAVLAAIGWFLFLVFSLDWLRLGRLFANLGLIGPIALLLLLLVGDILLLTAFLDMLPSGEEVLDALQNGFRYLLPFVDGTE
jgi:hypothetical protein